MDNLEVIIDRHKQFMNGLMDEFDYDEVITGVITGVGRRIAETTGSVSEANELGRLIAAALVGAVEAAAKDQAAS